jgi:hypothetical protein
MEFVINTSTQVKGQVKVGTMVAVEYQSVSVTVRS